MIPHSVGKCHEVTKGTGARQAGAQRTLGEGEKSFTINPPFKLQIIGLNGMVKTIPYVWCWRGRGVKTKAYAQSMASLDETPRVSRENDILPYS